MGVAAPALVQSRGSNGMSNSSRKLREFLDRENVRLKAERAELIAAIQKIDRTSMGNAAIIEARALLAKLGAAHL